MKITIAVLITCHNRKERTLSCLKSLFSVDLPKNIELNIFLVDDGSIDGTSIAIQKLFPQVHIIQGNGTLFWNQGMRLAWKTAFKVNDYDFYCWLNDDVILDNHSLSNLLLDYHEAKVFSCSEVIISAACRIGVNIHEFSYGGRTDSGIVVPNGKLQRCKYINGNFVLVPRSIFKEIGYLSNHYTHALGDNDYGLRALEKGFLCFTSKFYLATCPPNEKVPGWCNPEISLLKRWRLFHSPLGLNIKEYNHYRKRFWGSRWVIFSIKAYLKTIFPSIYAKLSKI